MKNKLSNHYQFDRFEIQPTARVLLEAGAVVNLGARAFDLLLCLVERRDRVVGRDELFDLIWPGLVVTDNNLNVQIAGLRKVLGAQSVQTVQGRGFRFMLHAQELTATPAAEPCVADGAYRGPSVERRVPKIDLSLSDAPSIAVLPFLNLSDDPQQDYFADGITEDITTELSRFKALFVISRNSSFSYKGRSVDVRTVSRELGVRYVVEGSVRRYEQRVRVTAQLVDAVTGNHLWAEKYDRVLEGEIELANTAFEAVRQLSPTYANRILTTNPGIGLPEHRRRYHLACRIAAGLEDESAAALLR